MFSFFKKREPDLRIRIGGVPIPHSLEPLHFLFAGSTGTGKSQALIGVLDTIRARGDRVIMVDSGGEALARWFHPGDTLLNPLDQRSAEWSPFSELAGPWDADRLAKSMIPDSEGSDREWQLYSQSLLAAVMQRLAERGDATNERLLYFLTVAKSEEIEQLVSGLPAQTLFDTGAAKMLSSVRGIIGSYLPSYRFLSPSAGASAWSIRRWIECGSGWLWLPYRDDQLPSLRPLISAWVGEAVSSILSLRPDPSRRIWLLLDELASLGRIQSMSDALTKGRKYGLRCVAGLQSVSQLRASYGREGAQTLLSCLSSSLTLRSADAETADYLSRGIGEAEVRRENRSRSEGRETIAEQRTVQRVVLPSEIQNLPDRDGYLSLAGDYPIARVQVPIVTKPEVIPPFVPRGSGGTAAPVEAVQNSSPEVAP
jgi:type IV secretory pathway TraG/TraD family ATPase VirD4